ncbi:MAG: GGDEF domain-containing protein [Paracoccaceae bacterium]
MMLNYIAAPNMLDTLCPMHCVISETGHITHVGPTLLKLQPGAPWVGRRFLEVLRMMRPREVNNMTEFAVFAGKKLHLEMRDAPRTALKGVAMPDSNTGGFILNLAFGISILDAVRDFKLTDADFAATDLTVEMLYLVEAKSAAMDASRKLNMRLQGAKLAAEEKAVTDTLTGLKNRRALDLVLERLIATRSAFSMMHVDLDYFKAVNDTLGHGAGDQVLLNVAQLFKKLTRHDDVVARVGGDEFVILLPDTSNPTQLKDIGERIIAALEIPMDYKGLPCRISGSIGTVTWTGREQTDVKTLMEEADMALYASKREGRGRQTFFYPELRKIAIGASLPKTE